MNDVGRLLLVFGVVLAVIGVALMLFGRFHLPGDFTFRSGNTVVYIPLATSVILSVVATIVLNLVFRQR
jgi:predicted membrane channel-forming protein YqfA (hemolysin III family)